MTNFSVVDNDLFLLTERCVRCASCAPACPTYSLTLNEAESPRGRITMLNGLASGQISATAGMQRHLDNCLTCRACEKVCPAEVEVGAILDQGRALLLHQHRPPWRQRLLNIVLDVLITMPMPVARLRTFARCRPVHFMARKLGLGPWLATLAQSPKPERLDGSRGIIAPASKKVQLFVGCLGEAMQSPTLKSAMLVLEQLGYEVEIPNSQGCCGALHQHRGDVRRALELAAVNQQAFSDPTVPVVYCATGCGASLAIDTHNGSGSLAHRAIEISDFVLHHGGEKLQYRPLQKKVLVHDPCSARYPLRCEDSTHQLLQNIEGIELVTLPPEQYCCGAAGSYMLTHATTAAQLARPIIELAKQECVDYVLSSNIGCALHLSALLPNSIRLYHPIELLASQLIMPSNSV